MGLKVLVMPVGQGSMNVVQGYDAGGNLVYLALVDCGSDSKKSYRPSDEFLFVGVVALMAKRAVTHGDANITHYLDHLIITHRDSDHLNLLTKSHLMRPFVEPLKKYDTGMTSLFRSSLTTLPLTADMETRCSNDDNDEALCFFHFYHGQFTSDPPHRDQCVSASYVFDGTICVKTAGNTIDAQVKYMVNYIPGSPPKRNIGLNYWDDGLQNPYKFSLVSGIIEDTPPFTAHSYWMFNYKIDITVPVGDAARTYTLQCLCGLESGSCIANSTFAFAHDTPPLSERQAVPVYASVVDALGGMLGIMDQSLVRLMALNPPADVVAVLRFIKKIHGELMPYMNACYPQIRTPSHEDIIAQLFAAQNDNAADKLRIDQIYVGGSGLDGLPRSNATIKALGGYSLNAADTMSGELKKLVMPTGSKLTAYVASAPQKYYRDTAKNIHFDTFSRDKSFASDENDRSFIVFYHYEGERKCVLPGDATTLTAIHYNKVLDKKLEAQAPALHKAYANMTAPHHGSIQSIKEGTLTSFYSLTNTIQIVVSAGFKNQHGHPHKNFIITTDSALVSSDPLHKVYANDANNSSDKFGFIDSTKRIYSCYTKNIKTNVEEYQIIELSHSVTKTNTLYTMPPFRGFTSPLPHQALPAPPIDRKAFNFIFERVIV